MSESSHDDWSKTFAKSPVESAAIRIEVAQLRRWAAHQDEEVGARLRQAEDHRQRAAEYRRKADEYEQLLVGKA
jgi:hypothetical protein